MIYVFFSSQNKAEILLGLYWLQAFGFYEAYFDTTKHSAFFQSLALGESLIFPNETTSINVEFELKHAEKNEGRGYCAFTPDRAREYILIN